MVYRCFWDIYIHVHLTEFLAHKIVQYVNRGAHDTEHCSLESVLLLVHELVANYDSLCYLLDVMLEIWLWRGRLYITRNVSFWFPLHSIVTFAATLACVERPDLLVPIILYFISYILLVVNFHMSRHPNPWKRCISSLQLNLIVLLGNNIQIPSLIKAYQGEVSVLNDDKIKLLRRARMKRFLARILSLTQEVSPVYHDLCRFSEDMDQEAMEHSMIRLLENRYMLPHILLRWACGVTRSFRNFVTWKEPYATHRFVQDMSLLATFWIVFRLNVVFQWILRILIFALLGPLMKLTDIYFFEPWYPPHEELVLPNAYPRKEPLGNFPDNYFTKGVLANVVMNMRQRARLREEKAHALRDLHACLYGEYTESVQSQRDDTVSIPRFDSEALCISEAESITELADHNPMKEWDGPTSFPLG